MGVLKLDDPGPKGYVDDTGRAWNYEYPLEPAGLVQDTIEWLVPRSYRLSFSDDLLDDQAVEEIRNTSCWHHGFFNRSNPVWDSTPPMEHILRSFHMVYSRTHCGDLLARYEE